MNTRKKKMRRHRTPLLSALAASMLCANLMATVSAHGPYQKYDTEGWSQPVISVLMQGLAHRESPWNTDGTLTAESQTSAGAMSDALAGGPGSTAPDGSLLPGSSAPDGISQGSTAAPGLSVPGEDGNPQDSSVMPNGGGNPQDSSAPDGVGNPQDSHYASNGDANPQGSSAPDEDGNPQGSSAPNGDRDSQDGAGNPPGQTNPMPGSPSDPQAGTDAPGSTAQYAFTEVAQDYFDDALLIGDSRAMGVALYSGWDNLTYYAENGMTVYNMFQSKAAKEDGKEITIEEALQKHSFGKIYLEIGINEMGTGTVDSFMEAYEGAVQHLRELQPDAIIYLCGIMYVKQSKSESDPIFNNPNIQARNDRIAGLADGEGIFYLDINEVVTDGTGNLNPAYTWDEVHLLGKYDIMWLEYFCSHGIVKDS